jgi:hypothetical protein
MVRSSSVSRVVPILALLVAAGCSTAAQPEPATPEAPPADAAQPPVASESPAPLPEEPVEPAEPTPPPTKTQPGLVGVEGRESGGAASTVTDSNGPEPGGTRTDSCPEGQHCVCDRAGGYSCAGTCQNGARGTLKGQ